MTGSGTSEDPYIISDVDDLQAIESDLTAYYELANDIDASATSGWNAGAGFLPLGQLGVDFTGSLNGRGYTISNLFINRPTEYVGLFLDNAGVIQRVGLVDCDITGLYVGAIARRNVSGGSISQCYATGDLKLPATGGYIGGFVFRNFGAITNCYSRCSVTGQGTSWIAGFCLSNTGELINCYSTGLVSGGTFEYGFDAGGGTVTNCFFDTETSGQSNGGDATGKTTAQMKTRATFADAGWDI